jgi:hypothetical protein
MASLRSMVISFFYKKHVSIGGIYFQSEANIFERKKTRKLFLV